MVYESDPGAAPDSEFVPGALEHAVVGNRGRLLDARRTPLTIIAVAPERGELEVRIDAFEDRGARWRLPLWEIERLQFARGQRSASARAVARLGDASVSWRRPLTIPADPAALARTRREIAAEREAVDESLAAARPRLAIDLEDCVRRRAGSPRLAALLDAHLAARDLADLDRAFSSAFVSNPRAGELVKGHAIVLAELGLCPFRGTIVRDPQLFAGAWSPRRRARHIVVRLAFAAEVWSRCGAGALVLYRGAAAEEPLRRRPPGSLTSATFSREVAAAHFAGRPTTVSAIFRRERVDPRRLLMTFLETRAMNERYAEAEAVLIGGPSPSSVRRS